MSKLSEKQLERLNKAREANQQAKLERVKQYDLNPVRCFCGVAIEYDKKNNKFCSRSCAAKKNNIGQSRNYVDGKYATKPCPECGVDTTNKFCSRKCVYENWFKNRLQEIMETGFLRGNPTTVKKFVSAIKGRKCDICNLVEWRNEPAPLVLDHINGKPSDWRLENLRLVCGNCNMQLPTFAGKNVGKGGGRPYRNKRYLEGKSY